MHIWTGIPRDRIVAVLVGLDDGREQMGSGFLIERDLVLTARHCTVDRGAPDRPVRWMKVVREVDGREAAVADVLRAGDEGLDVGAVVLHNPDWTLDSDEIEWARIDRQSAHVVEHCQAAGYPLWQLDPTDGQRNLAQFEGEIRTLDDVGSDMLVMRDPLLSGVGWGIPTSVTESDRNLVSVWGGLSGAVVFHGGRVIGVVTEHHPRQSGSAVRVLPIERVASASDPEALALVQALHLPALKDLPWVEDPVEALGGLVDLLSPAGDLPQVKDLDPYTLGATPTDFGRRDTYRQRDPYVPRTVPNVDTTLHDALQPRAMVLLIGPSKAGKTRTAFEAVRATWADARIAQPGPGAITRLISHPRITSTKFPLVLWLDDLEGYIGSSDPLTTATLAKLFLRPGPTVVMATLRDDEEQRLRDEKSDLGRSRKLILASAIRVRLTPLRESPIESAAAISAYPSIDLSEYGLAEQLAGGPALLDQYRTSLDVRPLLHAVIESAIDWTRSGMPRPIPEEDLKAIARESLWNSRPALDYTEQDVADAIATARNQPKDVDGRILGPTPALSTVADNHTRSYKAFSYLIAADEGQVFATRPIFPFIWDYVLQAAHPDDLVPIGDAAHSNGLDSTSCVAYARAAERNDAEAMYRLAHVLMTPSTIFEDGQYMESPHFDPETGRLWMQRAAEEGNMEAMYALGYMAAEATPEDRETARDWWTKAAAKGSPEAMVALGELAATSDPPDLTGARRWWTNAAGTGRTDAMLSLGDLSRTSDPPDLDAARTWYEQAAELGNSIAVPDLAQLHMELISRHGNALG